MSDQNEKLRALIDELDQATNEKKGWDAEITRLRGDIEKEMETLGNPEYNRVITDENGVPTRSINVRLDPVWETSLDSKTLEGLLTEEEKKPFTKFKMGVGDLEKATKPGKHQTITRDDPAEMQKIMDCIKRQKGDGHTLVIKL